MRPVRTFTSWAIAGIIIHFTGQVLLANSGTQLPLSQYQAGTESTSSALVVNGTFEAPGAPNPNTVPTGWSTVGTMQVGTPVNPPSPASTVGSFAAQGALGSTATAKFTQTVTLAPNTNYVLSAYLWCFSVDTDLAIAELVDANDPASTKTLALTRTAADLGDGAGGYFVYTGFNSNFFSSANPILEVEFDYDELVGGSRPDIAVQIDNVAITPGSEFGLPRLIPEPAALSLIAIPAVLLRRRRS